MKWMHLSDIHLNKEFNNILSDILREELPQYIRKNHLSADYLFITGDYCDSAYKRDKSLKEDIDLAAKNVADYIIEIARSLHVSTDHIYLVPGNHDLERGSNDKATITQALSGYYSYKDGFREEERNYLVKRFEFFHKIHSLIHPQDNEWEKSVHRFYTEDKFDILCLNTAIAIYGEEKEGDIVLDCAAVKDTLEHSESTNRDKPLFVLAHHSMNYLKEQEKENLKYLFKNRPVYYLCGHAHKLEFHYDNESNTWEIMVGTTKNAKGAAPIFSIGEITTQDGLSSLSFYKYLFEEKGKWILYQKISSEKFMNKLGFIGSNIKAELNTNSQTVPLPLQNSQASTSEDRAKAIEELAKIKYAISTINGRKRYTISMMGLPVNAGILVGYALNQRQEIRLNYQQGDTIFSNLTENRCLAFEETVIPNQKELPSKSVVDLCIYIQAKSRNDGMSSFEKCIRGENTQFIPQNPYVVKFINTENYDESINLETSASYLVDKIVEHRENILTRGADNARVHIFYNGFLGLAVLLGNQMATTFPVELYDHDMENGKYNRSFSLKSNMFLIDK